MIGAISGQADACLGEHGIPVSPREEIYGGWGGWWGDGCGFYQYGKRGEGVEGSYNVPENWKGGGAGGLTGILLWLAALAGGTVIGWRMPNFLLTRRGKTV